MSLNDPRILSILLEDLIKHMQEWMENAISTGNERNYVQRQAKEQVERVCYEISIAIDQVVRNEEDIARIRNDVNKLISETDDALRQSLELKEEVSASLQGASQTLSHWEYELSEALIWLRQAQEWLQRALYELRQAQSILEAAENDLRVAENRLKDCCSRTDNRDCHNEQNAVNAALVRVQMAMQRVNEAKIEVDNARAEVNRAQVWVDRCKQSVLFAQEAVKNAKDADEFAEMAKNYSERSQEDANSAERFVFNALDIHSKENEIAEALKTLSLSIQHHEQEAGKYLREATSSLDSAYQLGINFKQEMGLRIDMLLYFDKPTISFL